MYRLDRKALINKYNTLKTIWDPDDKWHLVTYRMIKEFINDSVKNNKFLEKRRVLNAGSGGNNYEMDEKISIHLDLASNKLLNVSNAVIGDVETIPFKENTFDLIICVGSVLNYCDPINVIGEFSRVIKSPGFLILEFENSFTFELLGKPEFNRGVTFVETFYNGAREKMWYFSETYIKNLVKMYRFQIIKRKRCHIISPLIYRLTKNEKFASSFAALDSIFCYLPIINRFSSNSILLLRSKDSF